MKNTRWAMLLALSLAAWNHSVQAIDTPATPLGTISALNVSRYMGTWHEIAKYPNRFQKQCIGNTSAEYRANPDGTVQVINRCRIASGEMDQAIGLAKQIGPADSPRLKVRFAPAWLSFLPQVWGDYWVIDLDENYQLAAVSEPSREYLWILSRSPSINQKAFQELLTRLQQQGFDTSRLEVAEGGVE